MERSCKIQMLWTGIGAISGLGRPFRHAIAFTQAGLVLGRVTLLAAFGKYAWTNGRWGEPSSLMAMKRASFLFDSRLQ